MNYTWWQVCLIAVVVTLCVALLLSATSQTVGNIIKAKQESKITEEMQYLSGQLDKIGNRQWPERQHGCLCTNDVSDEDCPIHGRGANYS